MNLRHYNRIEELHEKVGCLFAKRPLINGLLSISHIFCLTYAFPIIYAVVYVVSGVAIELFIKENVVM